MSQLLFIDEETVRSLINIKELVTNTERGLINFSKGRDGGVIQPVRSAVEIASRSAHFFAMPCYSEQDNALATKLVCFYPQNNDFNLPSIHAIITLFDCITGVPQAVIDGRYVTEVRTAAASAVATKHLASDNADILCILGSGAQARSHLLVMKEMFDFREVRIWSRTRSNTEKLADEMGAVIMDTVEEAVSEADVICTTTNACDPIVLGKWIKPGAHINAVGSCTPTTRELDDELMHNAIIIADSRDAAIKEAGNIILSNVTVYGELGEVASGKIKVDRNQITVFESLGLAIEDAVSARLIYDQFMAQKNCNE